MKKLFICAISLLLCCLLSACGDLTAMTRYIFLEETISSPSISIPRPSAPSNTAEKPLYESYSYFLSSLTEKERTIFYALYEGVMAFQKSIPLPVAASADEVNDLMSFLCHECPELLQIDSAWTQRTNLFGNVTAVSPSYTMDSAAYEQKRADVEALLSGFHAQLSGCDSYQIELTLYQHIINHCTYSLDSADCQNAWGALIGGAAKCDGRAKALVWGLRSFGITSSVITGSNHAWVIAQINGYHYNVDPTYDDNETDGMQQPCSYTHFNVPQSSIASDPYPPDELFIRRGYPSTVRWDHNYHVRSGLWIPSGQSAENAFFSQLEAAAAVKNGSINLRFESAADYTAASQASQNWIQSFLNQRGLSCQITSYDYSTFHTLFLQLNFQ